MNLAEIPQTIADLRAAASHIERVGWTQGILADDTAGDAPGDCPVCAIGAINMAVYGDPFGPWGGKVAEVELSWDELRELGNRSSEARMALSDQVGASYLTVPVWNDLPGRTGAEVIAALKAAADALEALL